MNTSRTACWSSRTASRAHRPRRRTAADPGGRHRSCRIPGRADHSGFVDTISTTRRSASSAPTARSCWIGWKTYTFPNEGRFSDMAHAREQAELFLGELLRNGTTTALVFGTAVHKRSVDAFFEACEKRNLRMIAGKVLMDRNAPEFLTDTCRVRLRRQPRADRALARQGPSALRRHPAFRPDQHARAAHPGRQALRRIPDLYMHPSPRTSRRRSGVGQAVPQRKGYLDVYDHHGLISPRSVFARHPPVRRRVQTPR